MKEHIIILLILFIIISLYNQCNKKNLNKLENDTIKNIIEAFSNYGSANAQESGQWGYRITGITDGRYGGRSKQEVLNNIDSHVRYDYITKTEKNKYSSYVGSIEGDIIPPSDCDIGNAKFPIDCETDCYDNKLSYIYDEIDFQRYGGSSCQGIDTIHSNIGYNYILKEDDVCSSFIQNSSFNDKYLTTISLYTNDYNSFEITDITETNWCGFFYSHQIFSILDLTDIQKDSTITKEQYNILNNNQKDSPEYLDTYSYLKYKKNEQYYILEITFESNISGDFDMNNPTFYIQKEFGGNYKDYSDPTTFTYTYWYTINIGYTIYYKLIKSLEQINLYDIQINFYLNNYNSSISWTPNKFRHQFTWFREKIAYDEKKDEANDVIKPALATELNGILDDLVDKNIYNVISTGGKSESDNMIHFDMVYSKSEPEHFIMDKVKNRENFNISFDINKNDLSDFKIDIKNNFYIYIDPRYWNNFTYTDTSTNKKINLNNFQIEELLKKI